MYCSVREATAHRRGSMPQLRRICLLPAISSTWPIHSIAKRSYLCCFVKPLPYPFISLNRLFFQSL